MAPRTSSGKRRIPQNNHRGGGTTSRNRGGCTTSAIGTTSASQRRHHRNSISLDDDYYYREGDDDADVRTRVQLLGNALSDTLHHIRSKFSSLCFPAILSNLVAATNAPAAAKTILVGVAVAISVVLLAPTFETYVPPGGVLSMMTSLLLVPWGFYPSNENSDDDGIVGAALPHLTADGKFHGRYPNSILTLFYPLTLYRDVVLDQPVDPSDVPFYWHPHVSDEIAVKAVLRRCYDADIVELNTPEEISNAKDANLISKLADEGRLGGISSRVDMDDGGSTSLYNGQRRRPLIVASPHIREVAELFSVNNLGRTFSFYRHPVDYDLHPSILESTPPGSDTDNLMVRLLSNVRVGALGFKELGTAKQVIRQTTISGTRDMMAESLFRFGKYYGWVPVGGTGTREGIESDDDIARACIGNMTKDLSGEKYVDHDGPEWEAFYEANKLDCELYEVARSTWRAQIQTIVPLTLQKRRAGEGDDDEKDGEDDEGGGIEGA
ncbi:hypothetical protein ACHAXA_003404 [Cyclostephanos tholiformis]|uniref:Uncharacterized protein n=1 Tax=Cyclostephanos tholiformis TaxID=382380 RepID=A0ABD3RCY7_9STRA